MEDFLLRFLSLYVLGIFFSESDFGELTIFFRNKPVVSLLFLKLEILVGPAMLLICNLFCHMLCVFSGIVQLVVCSHKLVFR